MSQTRPKWNERPWPPTANNWEGWRWHHPQAGDVFTLQLVGAHRISAAANHTTWGFDLLVDPNEALIFLRYEGGRLYFKRPFDPRELWIGGQFAKVTLQEKRGKLWDNTNWEK